ncbi:MAG: alpha/beta hydrolase fold domain-containing protein, partial [Myxococcota bacterium]
GTVAVDPPDGPYADRTRVVLTAVPEAGYAFAGWTGDLTGSLERRTLVMDRDRTVGAAFEVPETYSVTLAAADNGQIELDPPGPGYLAGTLVTATSIPDPGFAFSGWRLGASGSDNPLELRVRSDVTLEASFGPGVPVDYGDPDNGILLLDPDIASGDPVRLGDGVRLSAFPAPGYAVDAVFKAFRREPNALYYLSQRAGSPWMAVPLADDARFSPYGFIDRYVVGAYFVPEGYWPELDELYGRIYVSGPGKKLLAYDSYEPPSANGLPIVVLLHGGQWASGDAFLMRGVARVLAGTGRYVAVAVNTRLTTDVEGPTPELHDIVQDVLGAIAHIQFEATSLSGDANRLALVGDGSGGHLAALATLVAGRLGDGGYDGTLTSEFVPSWMPPGDDFEAVSTQMVGAIRATATLSGVFTWPGWDVAMDPLANIPDVGDRQLPPQLCQVGGADLVVDPADIKAYVDALRDAGQSVTLQTQANARHGYAQWKPDAQTRAVFDAVGRPALDDLVTFLDGVFAP